MAGGKRRASRPQNNGELVVSEVIGGGLQADLVCPMRKWIGGRLRGERKKHPPKSAGSKISSD
jgi:hypothetical protein